MQTIQSGVDEHNKAIEEFAKQFTAQNPPQFEEVIQTPGGTYTIGFWHTEAGLHFAEKQPDGLYYPTALNGIAKGMGAALAKCAKMPTVKLKFPEKG